MVFSFFSIFSPVLVCYTAVFSVVTQRGGALRDDTKNGCVADYPVPPIACIAAGPRTRLNHLYILLEYNKGKEVKRSCLPNNFDDFSGPLIHERDLSPN